VFTGTVLLLLRLSGLLHRAGDGISKPAGQTAARWQVIGSIGNEPRTVADVARRMELARQSVQRIADVLVSEGIAVYEDNPAHQRAKLLALTALGRQALKVIREGQGVWANRVGGQLGEKVLLQINALLQQILDTLQRDPLTRDDP
jgi:DNA-binding MarR family transcriptional regulator